MKKLKAAIVGCGRISVSYADAFHRLSDEVELAYAVDKDPALAKAFAEEFTVPGLRTLMRSWIRILMWYISVCRISCTRSWPSKP